MTETKAFIAIHMVQITRPGSHCKCQRPEPVDGQSDRLIGHSFAEPLKVEISRTWLAWGIDVVCALSGADLNKSSSVSEVASAAQREDACWWMAWTPLLLPLGSDTEVLPNSIANTAVSSRTQRRRYSDDPLARRSALGVGQSSKTP
jgi:hypothetical protein